VKESAFSSAFQRAAYKKRWRGLDDLVVNDGIMKECDRFLLYDAPCQPIFWQTYWGKRSRND
jgi:hypothetical protein